jgi:hypothetical protein
MAMPIPIALTESQRATLTNALRVAAERFDDNVKKLRGDPNLRRLAEQFDQQRADAFEMATLIENAGDVLITTYAEATV